MGNDTNLNWSVLIHLYGKYFVMWVIFKNGRISKKITQTRNYIAIEAFFNVTPLRRFRGITQIRIEVFSLIWFGMHYVIWAILKWPPYKKVESNKQSIFYCY